MTESCSCQEKTAPLPLKITLVGLNARYIHSCLALFYIRNELAVHLPEMEVEILQLTINDNSYESLLQITKNQPFAVFFSAAVWNSDCVEKLVRDVHCCLPECRIVVGGPQAGVLREILPERCCSVVLGEIEAVGSAFYDDLRTGQMKAKYTGSFLKLPQKQLKFPYCEEDFSGPLKNRYIYYETSRGCPYSCTYCLSAAERGLYHKDVGQVKTELQQILQHSPRVVRFVDRTFNDMPERAMTIWQFLAEQNCETLFHFEIAPEKFTEEMFTLLESIDNGRFQFEIGIQSTNDATLEAIHRRIEKASIQPIIERLVALKTIHLHVDLILGLPYETSESFATSFADVYTMGAHYIQMGLLKILPDTPICHGAVEYGYIHSSHPPYSIFANNWLDHRTMQELYWFCECVEKFHNNRYFVSLWNYLRTIEEDICVFFQELLRAGQKHDVFHRAATQELLCSIMAAACSRRDDFYLIIDILRYDWLRCGYRKLPECLECDGISESMAASRDIIYNWLPESMDGVYTAKTRNLFFKRSVFLRLSYAACRFLSIKGAVGDVRIALTQEREKTLHGHNCIFLLDNNVVAEN